MKLECWDWIIKFYLASLSYQCIAVAVPTNRRCSFFRHNTLCLPLCFCILSFIDNFFYKFCSILFSFFWLACCKTCVNHFWRWDEQSWLKSSTGINMEDIGTAERSFFVRVIDFSQVKNQGIPTVFVYLICSFKFDCFFLKHTWSWVNPLIILNKG